MSLNSLRTVRSMTGQGHASEQGPLGAVHAEVRTVNHRGFKCVLRVSDALNAMEPRLEALARKLIHRGTVNIKVNWRRPPGENLPNLDTDILQSYIAQLEELRSESGELHATIDLASLLSLPGVIASSQQDLAEPQGLWEFVSGTVIAAIENLNQMRAAEGANMAQSLLIDCDAIERRLETITQLAPRAADAYRVRLESKIRRVLQENNVETQAIDLLREIQVYSDRVDISEELTRLRSHLDLFRRHLQEDEAGNEVPTGRKLDFITQEMFRETNTIGSKASDADISAEVVEIKCAIERMRELVQNLE